jgi:hypothetical protein
VVTDPKKLAREWAEKKGIQPRNAKTTWFSLHEMVHFGEFVQQATAMRCADIADHNIIVVGAGPDIRAEFGVEQGDL